MTWIISHFVHPGMLAGLALVLVPILIWLFSRLRFRVVDWAAQTFLLRALKRSQRRLKIENLLLLLIRCLVIALFVAALARPRGHAVVLSDTTDARKNVVLVLDTSYSTGYQVGSDAQQTVHEREKRAAREIVRQLRPVDRLSLIAFDESARKVYVTPRTVDARTQREILDELDGLPEVQRSARGTDYAQAFHLLPEVLRRFDAGPDGQPPLPGTPPSRKAVFLLTDAQRAGLLAPGTPVAGGIAPASALTLRDPTLRGVAEDLSKLGATVYVVDCGADEPKNAGIVTLETREPIVGVNLPCYVECTVRNFGAGTSAKGPKGEALAGLTLEYFVDGGDAPVKAVSLDLLPEETKLMEPLRYVFHDKGPHRIVARLRSDALQLDNERALVVDVRDAVRVLLVDGDPRPEKWQSETDALRVALDPYGEANRGKDLIQPEVVAQSALPVGQLRNYDLIVVANVASLPDDHVAALEQFAKEGGAVCFSMGSLVDRSHYNEKLWRRGAGLFPCELGDVKGLPLQETNPDRNAAEWTFALANPEHPALRTFAEEEMKPHLRLPSVYRYVEARDLTAVPDKGPAGLASVPLKLVPRPPEAQPVDRGAEAAALREGAAALVEKPFGRGRSVVYMMTVRPDRGWSDAPWYDTFWVVFWRQLALELARTSRPKRNLQIGERYERVIGTGEYAPTIEVLAPDAAKETFRPEAIEGREQFRISYPPTAESRVDKDAPKRDDAGGCDRPGVYEVRLTGGSGDSVPPPPDYFAVRLDASEGDVAKLDLEDWKEQLPGLDVRRAAFDNPVEALQGTIVSGQTSDELWPHAVAAVVALLAIESVLAALFGRRRQ